MENRLPGDALLWQAQSDLSIRLWGQISGSADQPFSIKANAKKAGMQLHYTCIWLVITMQFQNSISIYGQHGFLNHSLGKRQR